MQQNQSQKQGGKEEGREGGRQEGGKARSLICAAESSAQDLCTTFIRMPFEQLIASCLH